jgi:predicted membrane protein
MDKLEWIDAILIAIFPLLGIILYFVYKNNGEDERAIASIWGMLIAIIIYIPLNLILPWFGWIIAFIIILVMFALNKQGKLLIAPPTDGGQASEKVEEAKVIPTSCPNCSASLSSESIDWIDNNTFRCPYCDSTVSV